MIYRTSRVRQVSLAALLLSSGIILGTVAPRARGAAVVVRQPPTAGGIRIPGHPATEVAVDTSAATPALEIAGAVHGEDEPPAFGGAYALLRGATTDAALPPGVTPSPAPENSPAFPGIPLGTSDTASRDSAAGADTARVPGAERFRPSPAQGIPRGVAADYPLLGVFEGAGRLLFHDLGVRPGVIPASIEGAWAALGDCGQTLQADFSASTRHAGELRAVGRGAPASPGSTVVVTARQACEAAALRFTKARDASEAERNEFGGLAPDGFAASDLIQVARSRGSMLLVYRSAGGSAAVLATTGPLGARAAWSTRLMPADGDLRGIGVFRSNGTQHAWLVVHRAARPTALFAVTSPDGNSWSSPGPVPLVNR